VILRMYDSTGSPATGEIQANTYTFSFQGYSRVGCDASGNFVVVWTSYMQDGDGYAVVGQRYRYTGVPRGGEFIINQYAASHQDYPDVAVSPDGSFVVVWHSAFQDGSSYGVYGRRYRINGLPLGGEFQINEYTTRNQWWPAIAMDDYGSYTVVWQSDMQDGSGRGVCVRRYRQDHTTHSEEFVVNSHTIANQDRPAIASDPAGNLVVVWQSELQDGSGLGVYGQRIETGTVSAAFASITAEEDNGTVRIRWQVASDEPLQGFNVYRSSAGENMQLATLLPRGTSEFIDEHAQRGTRYTYRVGAIHEDGHETLSPATDIDIKGYNFRLFPNRPNPFHPGTTIEYELGRAESIEIRIFDAAGRLVISLESGLKPSGRHTVTWDGRDARGERVGSGVYFYRLQAGQKTVTRKMLFLK
jgi:hypothetical protein